MTAPSLDGFREQLARMARAFGTRGLARELRRYHAIQVNALGRAARDELWAIAREADQERKSPGGGSAA